MRVVYKFTFLFCLPSKGGELTGVHKYYFLILINHVNILSKHNITNVSSIPSISQSLEIAGI